jgi:hypothetical protein
MAASMKLDRAALSATISGQERVISRQQALSRGLPLEARVHPVPAYPPPRLP